MVKDILMVLGGIVGGAIFVSLQQYIITKVKTKALPSGLTVHQEPFNVWKFLFGMTNIGSGTAWAKDIHDIFNLRKLAIIGVIISCVYGYGWYQGTQGKPALINLEGKEATIKLNEHFMKIAKDGTVTIVDKDGKVLKTISVKDVAQLRLAMKPYGFEMKPFVTAGGSFGTTKSKLEAGVGVEFFKWYKANLNAWLTNMGAYVGPGYRLTDNCDALLGVGKGYKGDTRIYGGIKFRF